MPLFARGMSAREYGVLLRPALELAAVMCDAWTLSAARMSHHPDHPLVPEADARDIFDGAMSDSVELLDAFTPVMVRVRNASVDGRHLRAIHAMARTYLEQLGAGVHFANMAAYEERDMRGRPNLKVARECLDRADHHRRMVVIFLDKDARSHPDIVRDLAIPVHLMAALRRSVPGSSAFDAEPWDIEPPRPVQPVRGVVPPPALTRLDYRPEDF